MISKPRVSSLIVLASSNTLWNSNEAKNEVVSRWICTGKNNGIIGDVRSSGLFRGIDIVKDNSIEPDTELAHHIKNELRNRYILINTDGSRGSVLKTKPPLRFSKEDAFKTVEQIDNILKSHYKINTV